MHFGSIQLLACRAISTSAELYVLVCLRLRDLLDDERAEYSAAAQSMTTEETALERQSRLRERARQLREKREAERLAFVEQKYEQQFRSEHHYCFPYYSTY